MQKSSSIYDVQINNIKINVRENEHRLWKDKKKEKEGSLICKYVQTLRVQPELQFTLTYRLISEIPLIYEIYKPQEEIEGKILP